MIVDGANEISICNGIEKFKSSAEPNSSIWFGMMPKIGQTVATGDDPWVERRWSTCREITANRIGYNIKHNAGYACHFMISVSETNLQNINRFLEVVESRLNLDDRTRFVRTNVSDHFNVYPAAFWYQQTISTSLLTLILRVGLGYHEGSSFEFMLDFDYFKTTKDAFLWFLDGNTHYVTEHAGLQSPYANSFFGWRDAVLRCYSQLQSYKKAFVNPNQVQQYAYQLWVNSGGTTTAEENWKAACKHFQDEFIRANNLHTPTRPTSVYARVAARRETAGV